MVRLEHELVGHSSVTKNNKGRSITDERAKEEPMNAQILLAEDDYSLRETTTILLTQAGMSVAAVSDGQEAMSSFRTNNFNLLLLDIMLPTLDGLEICKLVRAESNIPIVMLTAKAETVDLVVGLELGADDYVTKPFEPAALIARLKSVLRRATNEPHAPNINTRSLSIDPVAFAATKNGAVLDLSATEFKLLLELARHPHQVMARDTLLRRVWEYDYMGDSRMVDMAIQRLRTKIEDDPSHPALIITVRGVGYRFEADE